MAAMRAQRVVLARRLLIVTSPMITNKMCPICGNPEFQHRHRYDETPPMGHAYPFTQLQRIVARLMLFIWPTTRALYIIGDIGEP